MDVCPSLAHASCERVYLFQLESVASCVEYVLIHGVSQDVRIVQACETPRTPIVGGGEYSNSKFALENTHQTGFLKILTRIAAIRKVGPRKE
jgi:hypothetical protein